MDKQLNQLEVLMRELIDEHERLLALVRRKTEAMKIAKPDLVTDCCQRENAQVQKIGRLETQRQQMVGELTQQWTPAASQLLTLAEIADRAGEPRRGRLLVLRQTLRQTMQTIRDENNVARSATEGLLRHVSGVIQHVTQAVAGAGTYGRRGLLAASPINVSSFSITG